MNSIDAQQLEPREGEDLSDIWQTLALKDNALPLMEASSAGDLDSLHNLLSQPEWAKIALEEQRVFRGKRSDPEWEIPMSNLCRALLIAAARSQIPVVSTLLAFAWEQRVDRDSIITRHLVGRTIDKRRLDVFEALALADSTVVRFNVHHGYRPLDITVRRRDTEFVKLLLRLGAPLQHQRPDSWDKKWSYSGSYLCQSMSAKGTHMTELLLEYGASVAKSGALHLAAECGRLEVMHLLMQKGADLNELLPEDTLSRRFPRLLATWAPMHFAAARGQVAAIKLLESSGARLDVVDENGKTPTQLLEEGCQDIELASG